MLGPRTCTSNSTLQKLGVLAGMPIGVLGVRTISLGVPPMAWPVENVTPAQVVVIVGSPW